MPSAGLSGSDDVGPLAARLDDTQRDLEAGNAALLARNLRLVLLLAEDACTLTGPAQVDLGLLVVVVQTRPLHSQCLAIALSRGDNKYKPLSNRPAAGV